MGESTTLNSQEAKQLIVNAAGPSPDDSLDATADALLLRVAQFFGECVGGDTFCGLSIDEMRDENGLLQSLRLVPCDIKDGEPVRRVGR
jgi:hypothetical protein